MRTGSGNPLWLLGDHLGSTSKVVNFDGKTEHSQQLYKPWGEKRYPDGASNLPTTYRFTGQRSETGLGPAGGEGLMYYWARWYDGTLGRFTQPDTVIPQQQGVQAWDRYAYVNNNPVKYTDPSGHCLPNQCGYIVDGTDGWVSPSDDETNDSSSPFDVGSEWLSGEGARQHVFVDGDPFTELLQQHEHIQDVRNIISQRLNEGDYRTYEENYYLGGLQGVPKYINDYSTLATFGKTGNLAVTFLGSYELHYYINQVDTQNRSAEITFYVFNESTLASATHPPVLGYTQFWEDNITPFMNRLANEGRMSRVTQTFLWTETISFP